MKNSRKAGNDNSPLYTTTKWDSEIHKQSMVTVTVLVYSVRSKMSNYSHCSIQNKAFLKSSYMPTKNNICLLYTSRCV